MEKYTEVMKQAIELIETMQEGIGHIRTQLNKGQYEQSVILFEDVMIAYATVERSLTPVLEGWGNEDVTPEMLKLRQSLEFIVSAYEQREYGKVIEIMQFSLIPQVKTWKEELEKAFHPYIVS
jgi:hypothetical protein